MNENKTNINYYPGHMAKTKRLIKENIDIIDVVYELIDARIPFSSKIKDVDELIKGKRKILVMSKKDLCDKNVTSKWIKYYENLGYNVLLLDLKDNNDFMKLVNLTKEITKDLQDKRESKGLKNKDIKVLVMGIPNVGKSSLINRLVGKKVANVENRPGVTKHLNFLPTKYGITLLDTPGILWPKFEDQSIALNIACIGSIKKEVVSSFDMARHTIKTYMECYPSIISDMYKIVYDGDDEIELIELLAKRWGFCKGGEVDYNKTSERIYNDLVSGKVKNVTFDVWK